MVGGKADRKFVAGIGISLFFLFLLFRKIEFHKLAAAFREMDYGYLWPAVFLTFVSYFFRAVRWRFLLLPLKTAPMSTLFSSTIIGYMANNLLPARLGEFVRAYVLAEKERLPASAVFATLVLDYIPDKTCIELKSLKLYVWSFRNEGAFHEAVTNRILDDLAKATRPRFMRLTAKFYVRGGIFTTVVAEQRKKGWKPQPKVDLDAFPAQSNTR